MSDAIIVAIIGGSFALLGAIVQAKKCCTVVPNDHYENTVIENNNDFNNRPIQTLNTLYEVVPEGKNDNIFDSKYIEIYDDIKYKIRVEPQLELGQPDIVNIFHVKKNKYNNCNLTLKLSKVTGKVYLFVKRFNDKWEFCGRESIEKILAVNGINILPIISSIGTDDVSIEQIGLMVYTCKNVISGCNIEEAKLEFN